LGYGEVIILPTLHPAAGLYNPNLRKYFEEDFRTLAGLLGRDKDKDKRPSIFDFLNGPRARGKEGNSNVLK